jgi:DNA-binding transcriptional ArsR family regulator
MNGKRQYELHAEVFAALANPMRHEIFHHIVEAPRTVSELAELSGATRPNVSQHLSVLARHGLAVRRRAGGRTEWMASDPRMAEACSLVDQVMSERLEGSLASLKRKVVSDGTE